MSRVRSDRTSTFSSTTKTFVTSKPWKRRLRMELKLLFSLRSVADASSYTATLAQRGVLIWLAAIAVLPSFQRLNRALMMKSASYFEKTAERSEHKRLSSWIRHTLRERTQK